MGGAGRSCLLGMERGRAIFVGRFARLLTKQLRNRDDVVVLLCSELLVEERGR